MILCQEKNFSMLAIDPRWKPTDEDFFYQSLLLHYVLPIDGLASNINLCYMETLNHANLSCLAPFSNYHLMPREKNRLNCFLLLPTVGIETWLPAQQASTLSITPLPLGYQIIPKEKFVFLIVGIFSQVLQHRRDFYQVLK